VDLIFKQPEVWRGVRLAWTHNDSFALLTALNFCEGQAESLAPRLIVFKLAALVLIHCAQARRPNKTARLP